MVDYIMGNGALSLVNYFTHNLHHRFHAGGYYVSRFNPHQCFSVFHTLLCTVKLVAHMHSYRFAFRKLPTTI